MQTSGVQDLLHPLADTTNWATTNGTWWLMSTALALGLFCLCAHGYRWVQRERAASTPTWIIPATLFAGALLLRILVPPWTHYTFNDEYDYLAGASTLRETGLFSFPAQPPLLLYLYALAFEVFPVSARTTFLLSAIVGSATVPLFWWCLRNLRVDVSVATLAATLVALQPLHVKHSGASSLEIVSLLFVVATLGSFARWNRSGGGLAWATLAVCLFAAATTRAENFVLVPILVAIAFILPERRRPRAIELLGLPAVVALAALYLPGAYLFHEAQDSWWKSELAPLPLLANNLAFWIGGGLEVGKLPFVLVVGGVLASFGLCRAAGIVWLLVLLGYSTIYVLHGVNLGYHIESLHYEYFADRSAGHDMFRFNLLLVPAISFFMAVGLVFFTQATRRVLTCVRPRASTFEAALVLGALLTSFLLVTGEYRAYDVGGFIASPYNRTFEADEYHFLEESLAGVDGPALCLVIGSTAIPYLGRGIEVRRLAKPNDLELRPGKTFLYSNSFQLAEPRPRRMMERLARAFDLRPFAMRDRDSIEFRLFRVRARNPSDPRAPG